MRKRRRKEESKKDWLIFLLPLFHTQKRGTSKEREASGKRRRERGERIEESEGGIKGASISTLSNNTKAGEGKNLYK